VKRCRFQHCLSSFHYEGRMNMKHNHKNLGPRCQYPHPHDESPSERGSQKFLFPSCRLPMIVIPGDKLSAFAGLIKARERNRNGGAQDRENQGEYRHGSTQGKHIKIIAMWVRQLLLLLLKMMMML